VNNREEPKTEAVIVEIALLLANAYQRHVRPRTFPGEGPLKPVEGLDCSAVPSAHELMLTPRRKDSTRS
jgi:hypothetical protein